MQDHVIFFARSFYIFDNNATQRSKMKCIGQLMWFLFKEIFDEIFKIIRGPKFGHPAPSLEF